MKRGMAMRDKLLYRCLIRYIAGDREGSMELLQKAMELEQGNRLLVPIHEILKAKGEIA